MAAEHLFWSYGGGLGPGQLCVRIIVVSESLQIVEVIELRVDGMILNREISLLDARC